MSNIANFFGVPENRAFTLKNPATKYMIMNGALYSNTQRSRRDDDWDMVHVTEFYRVAEKLDEIILLPPAPTYATKVKLAALKLILPDFCWAACDGDGSDNVYLYKDEPKPMEDKTYAIALGQIYAAAVEIYSADDVQIFKPGEITHEMGPIYYGDLRLKGEVL